MGKVIEMKPKKDSVMDWKGSDWKRMWEGFRDKYAEGFVDEFGLSREDLAWAFLASFVSSVIEMERNGIEQ